MAPKGKGKKDGAGEKPDREKGSGEGKRGGGPPSGKGKGKGSAGGKGQAQDTTKKEGKAKRKAEKAAVEALRQRELQQMMSVMDSASDEEDENEGHGENEEEVEYDSFGNIIDEKARKAMEREKLIKERKERIRAKAQAEAETAAAAGAPLPPPPPPTDYGQKAQAEVRALQEKVAAGATLTRREKKQFQKLQSKMEEAKLEEKIDTGLAAFSLSLRGGTTDEPDDGAADVIVDQFSIAAPKRVLFHDAALKLAQGRKYGLLGPNGRGKSTLLRFLAARELPIPQGIDVLLVEQEAHASASSVVEQVLAGHTRRKELLA
ncbi:unnamed protein product, partial [Chrysoparadoxa australica]